ncbi:VCBS repeat-containing protein [Streptomyces sp. NPDC097619]|uniref:VCBS repeat-containing protein n=1 Tax=Streptomyces sp. NPDC097619 TaxID=3157228 RepID=UPI00332968F3
MNTLRHKRLSRIATCTALAIAAGTALATPAAAEPVAPGAPAARSAAEQRTPQPTGVLPEARRGGLAARAAGAAPLFDLNGDGRNELLYRTGADHVLKTWTSDDTPFTTPLYEDSAYKDLIPVGDLDQDGSPELLALTVTGELSLATASTSGFGYTEWTGKGWQVYNKVLGAGDLTGDGRPDVLARKHNGELYLYAGRGTLYGEPFRAAVKVGAGWQTYDQIVAGGDLNADGTGDLVARTPAGDLYFYKGTRSAAAPFAKPVKIGTGWGIYNQLLNLGDANGDGDSEILARDVSGTTWYYAGNGNGTLAARQKSGTNWQWTNLFAGQGGVPAHGKKRLVGRNTANTLYVYGTSANGALSAREKWSDDGGWPDFAPITSASSMNDSLWGSFMYVYQGRLHHENDDLGAGWGAFNALVGPGDLSGDGKGDLLARDRSGVLWLYRGNGRGTAVGSKSKIGAGWGGFDRLLGGGDFTGDGRADLIARTTGGTLYVYPGTGNASAPFGAKVKIGTGFGVYNKMASPGDMNGDGRADLVGTDSQGNAYRYVTTGLGGASTLSKRVLLGGGWNTYKNLY